MNSKRQIVHLPPYDCELNLTNLCWVQDGYTLIWLHTDLVTHIDFEGLGNYVKGIQHGKRTLKTIKHNLFDKNTTLISTYTVHIEVGGVRWFW